MIRMACTCTGASVIGLRLTGHHFSLPLAGAYFGADSLVAGFNVFNFSR